MSSLWIINKAGGLIFQSEHFKPKPSNSPTEPSPTLSSNEYLILAGTLHGIHAITSRLNPIPGLNSSGIQSIEADGFIINVLMTATGTKFVLISPTTHPNPTGVLSKAYQAYSDQVMKNPFYTSEMPIRVKSFDESVERLVLGGR